MTNIVELTLVPRDRKRDGETLTRWILKANMLRMVERILMDNECVLDERAVEQVELFATQLTERLVVAPFKPIPGDD